MPYTAYEIKDSETKYKTGVCYYNIANKYALVYYTFMTVLFIACQKQLKYSHVTVILYIAMLFYILYSSFKLCRSIRTYQCAS